jgi:tRNA 2-thiouridine synthesizing protein A
MKMRKIVDARGLSCPQPVLLTLNEIKRINKGEIVILVDTDTSKENVSRAATTQGWQVEVKKEDEDFRLILTKDERDDLP